MTTVESLSGGRDFFLADDIIDWSDRQTDLICEGGAVRGARCSSGTLTNRCKQGVAMAPTDAWLLLAAVRSPLPTKRAMLRRTAHSDYNVCSVCSPCSPM